MISKVIVGRTTRVSFPTEELIDIPAKIDSGADGSAIWASGINIDDSGVLSFSFFDKSSPLYTGKRYFTKEFNVTAVRSSHGSVQVRYRIKLSVNISGRRVLGTFSLADRAKNKYPVLIGCRLLAGKFLVDVAKDMEPKKLKGQGRLNFELQKSPRDFFERYHVHNIKKEY